MKKTMIFVMFLGFVFYGNLVAHSQNNINESKNIHSLIEKKREYNRYNGSGFRIQLYNGLEKRARNHKYSFEKDFPGVYTKLLYDNPEWKVQVGSYRTRLDADRALNKIREKFSGAIIIEK